MQETVLIGFADALAAPETIFSLRNAGHRVRVFTRDAVPTPAVLRLGVGAPIMIPAPEKDAAGAVAALRAAVAADPAVTVAMALDDAALWLIDAAFSDGGAPLLASESGPQAAFALDKTAQLEAARLAGFEPPPSVVLESADDARRIERFPAIVKSARAAQVVDGKLRRGGAIYLMSEADLGGLGEGDVLFPAIAQPLVSGVGEGIFGFAGADGVSAWSAHRRVRMMNPHGSGASACRSKAVDPALRDCAGRLITAIGWRGPFMIELLRDGDGRTWFMEFNGRLWGSTALARRTGFEHPAWAVAQARDPGFRPPEPPPYPEDLEVRHLGREIVHLAFVLRGPRSAFHRRGWPSFAASAIGALSPGRGRSFYNYDPAHPWFFLRDAAQTVAGFLGRGKARP